MIARMFLVVLSLFLTVSAQALDRPSMVLNELIIGLKEAVEPQSYFGEEWANARQVGSLRAYVLKVDAPTEDAVRAECERRAQDSRVEYAEPNGILYIGFPPGSPVQISEIDLPILHNPSFPASVPGIKQGKYFGTLTVEKSVDFANLSHKYALRVQADVDREGRVTILTSTMQGPGSVSTAGAEPAIYVTPNVLGQNGNCRVDGRFDARMVPTKSGFILKYEVVPDGTQSGIVPVVKFQFTFRKQS